jgi:hypothetical protein
MPSCDDGRADPHPFADTACNRPPELEIQMRKIGLFVALLLFAASPAWAEGKLDVLGKFLSNGTEFDLAIYREGGETVALVGIAAAQRTSVAFSTAEWHSFVELWRKAEAVHGATWQPVGTFKESDTQELALLTVTAGPGVQFNIDGNKGHFTFVLPKSDFAAFDAKVQEMTAAAAVRTN